jgi:uncharacterized membrane-anchored protein
MQRAGEGKVTLPQNPAFHGSHAKRVQGAGIGASATPSGASASRIAFITVA